VNTRGRLPLRRGCLPNTAVGNVTGMIADAVPIDVIKRAVVSTSNSFFRSFERQ
jgi:hypothetical protein